MRWDEVSRLQRQLKVVQRRMRREVAPVPGVSRVGVHVLRVVARERTCTPGHIASELAMTSSNVASTLRVLDEAGLIVRSKKEGDGRRTDVSLSEQGHEAVRIYRNIRTGWLGTAIEETLTPEEQAALVHAGDLLERLAEYPGHAETMNGPTMAIGTVEGHPGQAKTYANAPGDDGGGDARPSRAGMLTGGVPPKVADEYPGHAGTE